MLTRSGIPTTYQGTLFRSRLEARWAAFFDLVRWSWIYEPIDLPGYIPDFLIDGPAPFLVEVGPLFRIEDYAAKGDRPRAAGGGQAILVVGASASPRMVAQPHRPVLGTFMGPQDWGAALAFGALIRCSCDAFALIDPHNDYRAHPCGHGDGNNHIARFVDQAEIDALWRTAGNRVQWRPGPQRIGGVMGELAAK